MKIDHAIVYFDRKALYEKSKELRAELDVAEGEGFDLSEWYFCLSEEEYAANAEKVEEKMTEFYMRVKTLREHLKEVEVVIQLMEKLETSLQYLENEKVV